MPIHGWDMEAARHYGALRASLERAGKPMGNLDTMIAAHALALNTVLVTHDQAFQRVKGLKTADWTLDPLRRQWLFFNPTGFG